MTEPMLSHRKAGSPTNTLPLELLKSQATDTTVTANPNTASQIPFLGSPFSQTRTVPDPSKLQATNVHASTPDQRWAYDLLVEPAEGHGSENPEDYGCYRKPVAAPVSARVHDSTDGAPNHTPGVVSNDSVKDLAGRQGFEPR